MSALPTPKYQIGDTVWFATTERTERSLRCPDCNDTKQWKVIAPSGIEMTCDCPRCHRYGTARTPSGQSLPSLKVAHHVACTRALTIGSVQINTAEYDGRFIKYMCRETGIGSGSVYDEARLFATEAEAYEIAAAQAAELVASAAETPRVMQAEHFSDLTIKPAFHTADWSAVYRAWDHARWMRETIDTVLDDEETNRGSKDEILEYIESRRDDLRRYEFIVKHPFEALLAAARASVDPVVLTVVADIDAKFPVAVEPVKETESV